MNRTIATAQPSNLAEMDLTIRRGTDADSAALERLAALDSHVPLAGPVLIAEVGGELWAARDLTTDEVIADPFRPTAHLIALLHERARHLRQGPEPRGSDVLSRLAAVLRPRRAGARSG
jgi:hypothetical protein